ncbi:MAG: hypothetical protein GXP24_10720 [Planctomycetes bacterium]|nr:hypothetical protein [Planctomycetota bacterium]
MKGGGDVTNRPLFLLVILWMALCLQQTNVGAALEVLVLQTRHQVGFDKERAKKITGLLPRELARQAFLIAARDELGLATRDQSLRETSSADSKIELLLTVDAGTDGNCLVQISQQADGGEEKKIWSKILKFEANSKQTYPTLITQLETLSRGEFVDLLVELGAEKPAEDSSEETEAKIEPPSEQELAELDQQLSEVDLLAQFLAIRKIGKLLDSQRESPELLGRLANAYANLGILTEGYWGATSRVFKARSLIYAERLRAKYDDYLFGRWHWAYARAMAGIHFAAIEQLEDPLPEGVEVADLPSLPAWAEVIEPYCRYDTEELGQLVETGNHWARYLRFWSFYLSDEKRRINSTAEETMKDCPLAFNLYSPLAHKGSLGIMHRVSRASMSAMYYACANGWAENAELPAAVQEAASQPPTKASPLNGWGAVLEALREEEDRADPSWQLLATLLEDTAAHVAAANLYVAGCGSTEQSLVPYVDAFLPALEHHPLRGYFVSRKYSAKHEPEEVTRACRDLRFVDPSLWIGYDTYSVWSTKNSRDENVGYDAYYGASRDFTASSLFVNSKRGKLGNKFRQMLLRELKKVSPYSPMVLVNEIKGRLKEAKQAKPEELAAWEERAGFSATAWHQLGEFYLKRLEYEDSCRCYETSFGLSPTYATARDWAWAYEYAKELDKVVPTLKLYLEEEDFGLGHSNTHYEIARFYLRHDRAEEAKPHALESAQSWSGRGLGIAAKVCERLELGEEAGKWFYELSKSYPTYSGLKWYLWCRRSGNVDEIEEAKKLALQQLGPQALQDCTSAGWWPLAYYLMEGDLDRALKMMKLRQKEIPGLYSDSFLLAIALDRDDKKLTEQSLDKLTEWADKEEDPDKPWSTRFAKAVTTIMAAESADQIPLEEFDPLIRDDNSTFGWCDACYFLSNFFEARGFTEHAVRYRDWGISFHDHDRITWHLAKFDAQQLKTPDKTTEEKPVEKSDETP